MSGMKARPAVEGNHQRNDNLNSQVNKSRDTEKETYSKSTFSTDSLLSRIIAVSYIDWSDSEELFGLLVEFIEDELGKAHDDSMRRRFLEKLDSDLMALQERITTMTLDETIDAFEEIHSTIEDDFENDPVIEHIEAFTEELKRIRDEAATAGKEGTA